MYTYKYAYIDLYVYIYIIYLCTCIYARICIYIHMNESYQVLREGGANVDTHYVQDLNESCHPIECGYDLGISPIWIDVDVTVSCYPYEGVTSHEVLLERGANVDARNATDMNESCHSYECRSE